MQIATTTRGRSIGIEDRVESLRPLYVAGARPCPGQSDVLLECADFGVSYYRAQQKADQFLMAEERRRKVAQNVLQDVRNSYWRALGAQRLLGRVDTLLERVNKALEQARQVEKDGLMPQAAGAGISARLARCCQSAHAEPTRS